MSKNKKTYEDACESLSDFIFDSDIVERIFAHLPRTHFDVAVDDANEQFNLVKELADLHNKAMDRQVINIVRIPKPKKPKKP